MITGWYFGSFEDYGMISWVIFRGKDFFLEKCSYQIKLKLKILLSVIMGCSKDFGAIIFSLLSNFLQKNIEK